MAQLNSESPSSSLELRFKRWTAVAVVCFLGLLAALPFRSAHQASGPNVAPSHRERSLRFRAEAASQAALEVHQEPQPPPERVERVRQSPQAASPVVVQKVSQGLLPASPAAESPDQNLTSTLATPTFVEDANRACYYAKRGETLMDIAERALGDRRRWRELMKLNPEHRSAFDVLAEGEEILLPEGR